MNAKMNRKWNEKGFSLIELLIAVSVLAVGLLAVAGMQGSAITANSFASTLSTATSLAQEAMEDLVARVPSDPLLAVGNRPYDLDPATAGNSIDIAGAGIFDADVTVATTAVFGISQITVQVTGSGRRVQIIFYKRSI